MTQEIPLPQIKRLGFALLGIVLLAGAAAAQPIQWSTPAGGAPLPPQEAFVHEHAVMPDGALQLSWSVMPGYYIYQDSLQVSGVDGPIALDLPEAERTEDMTFGETWVYRDDIQLTLPPQQGTLIVEWQGCQDGGICYPPQSAEISLSSATATPPTLAAADTPAQASLTLADEPGLMDRLGARGLPILLAAFFGFGLALAFTPCVLPMLPILGGLLARDGAGLTRRRGFMLSSAYVFAMAAAFGLLGLAAAATGQNLQMALQSPIAIGLIIGLFAVLALSMFGLFEVSLPGAWLARLQGPVDARRGTLGGALGLGFTSALVVGPCVTAPLAAALLYIAQTGDMPLGSAALFMLGLGKGAPLIVFGTLGGRYLPRSGPWMVRVKQGFGFVFMGLALWLAERVAPGPWFVALWALWLATIGIFLLRAVLADTRSPVGRGAVRLLAALALVPALVLGVMAARGAQDPLRPFDIAFAERVTPLPWQTVSGNAGFQAALAATHGPTVIYLTADWCITCRTIDRRVLPDADVVAALAPLTRIKVDLTAFDSDDQALLALLGAAGPPTMIFLDAERRELAETRLVGDTRIGPLLHAAQMVTP
ncbi:MAG: protein-disulfide reductase DsbD [Pararhodobacter sp.]|nr:protein-disulfide reductase DsbD [Pararhodobacter sp.]